MDRTFRSGWRPDLGLNRVRNYADSAARHRHVLNVTAMISAVISSFFAIQELLIGQGAGWIPVVYFGSAAVFVTLPLLHRFGELVPALVFITVSYASVTIICVNLGTNSGLQFYFLVATAILVMVLGLDHLVLASVLAVVGAVGAIVLQFVSPDDTGAQPSWALNAIFVLTVLSAWVLVFATLWYALREISRAHQALEVEHERSERLLTNILPATIADRLKDPARTVIADKYDDASVLFADIAGFTKWASDTTPSDLVHFLDRLYTDLDGLVDHHGLEKVKTSGDSYMVVSGVPQPRPDHLEALACLALDIADAVADLRDPHGRKVPLRIGLAPGPVVAGVIGVRKFFYDVWGDAVNVASRMETTDVEGRIQVPHDAYERLCDAFVFEHRGEIAVKGKGVMTTWFLVARRDQAAGCIGGAPQPVSASPTSRPERTKIATR